MKKLVISMSTLMATLFFVSAASATLLTCVGDDCPEGYNDKSWSDALIWEPPEKIGFWGSESYTHDISDGVDGFNVGTDYVYSYSLTVGLHDDGGRCDGFELALINQEGFLGDGFYNFSYANNTYGWSFAGLASLNSTGGLTVSVDSWWGDFYLDSSQLDAEGCSPVPEPATMLLFGSGLAAFAGRKLRRPKKE